MRMKKRDPGTAPNVGDRVPYVIIQVHKPIGNSALSTVNAFAVPSLGFASICRIASKVIPSKVAVGNGVSATSAFAANSTARIRTKYDRLNPHCTDMYLVLCSGGKGGCSLRAQRGPGLCSGEQLAHRHRVLPHQPAEQAAQPSLRGESYHIYTYSSTWYCAAGTLFERRREVLRYKYIRALSICLFAYLH